MLARDIKERVHSTLVNLGKNRAIIIYGARQVGKTTLAKELFNEYVGKKEFFNCDFPDIIQLFSYDNVIQLEKFVVQYDLIILDEAQRIKDIGMVIKILVDKFPKLKIIATGSSSFDLSNEFKEPLTGRKYELNLYPFSFMELYRDKSFLEQRRQIEFHLRFGFYPDVVLGDINNIETLLKEISGSYLFKDIFIYQQLKKPEVLIKLLRLLAFQVGSEVSFQELAQNLGVDQTVIQRYIHILEEAYIIFRLGAFKRNLRNEINKSRKIYFWDLGIRNILIQNLKPLELRDDVGALWENFCIAERLKHCSNFCISANSYFWRTYSQKEIDYIEEREGTLFAYEFKWNSKKKVKLPKDFTETYPNNQFKVIDQENFVELFLE